jgi:arylsulfatase A-like enzyme
MGNRPNILIFMTDHQRSDTVWPDSPALTPNVDRLAAEGLIFNEAYCPSPHCCPSRATFFTGLYPSQHGVWNNIANENALSHGLSPGVRIWSEDLVEAGYQMHYDGKWHVSVEESPADRGWEEHFASGVAGEHQSRSWEMFKESAASLTQTERGEAQILRPGYGAYTLYSESQPGDRFIQHDEKVFDIAGLVLPDLLEKSDPWCLYVGMIGPHDPYNVPRKFLDLYDPEQIELPPNFADDLSDKPRIYQRMRDQVFGQLSEAEVRDAIRHYYAYCTYLDDLFGQILQVLDASAASDDTLVIYCSDHGDYAGDHGLFAKGIPCFRGAYNIPIVMRWPNGISNPGRQEKSFVSLADIAPTLLEVAGVQVERDFAGQSLLPFMHDSTPLNWREAVFTQCNGIELYFTQRSVRASGFKLTFNGFDQDELYDLRNDPHEMVNQADNPKYADIKKDLYRRLWQFAYQNDDHFAQNPYITVALAEYGPGCSSSENTMNNSNVLHKQRNY